ncbi:transporter substrate-binding domain-containing protein [Paracoccus caeni]|uniref:Transporter substrate-binding domain-containing protein n=1 Tax=Paracoccus caeni TaxID=657651 RepID=A0A934SD16_9RHOB|nr:transporter substrate-binding domain-containing protein [Paracoccus caeni]MBK4215667.1 transporter substrate-binding domain-containing protein [Paracoccus caeni]
MKTLTIVATMLALTAGAAAAQTVRMGTEGAYPPYNFINDAGEITGFERELGDELCKRAKLDCTWVKNDWDSIIPNLVSSNYDTIMAGMNINEERKQAIDFTQPYTPAMPSAYVALSGDVDVEGDVVVAAQTNTIQASHVAETDATLLEYPTPDETLAAVRNGEAEAVFADKDFLAPFVEESNGELVWVTGFETVVLGEGIGMGVRKSDAELKGKFDAAITSMKDDGSLNELLKKWFGEKALQF